MISRIRFFFIPGTFRTLYFIFSIMPAFFRCLPSALFLGLPFFHAYLIFMLPCFHASLILCLSYFMLALLSCLSCFHACLIIVPALFLCLPCFHACLVFTPAKPALFSRLPSVSCLPFFMHALISCLPYFYACFFACLIFMLASFSTFLSSCPSSSMPHDFYVCRISVYWNKQSIPWRSQGSQNRTARSGPP